MPFYYMRLADQPIHNTDETARFRNMILTNTFDSPELMLSVMDRMGYTKMKEGTYVLRTKEGVSVIQKIVVKFDSKPTIKHLASLNAKADKALFDAKLAAKTLFGTNGEEI